MMALIYRVKIILTLLVSFFILLIPFSVFADTVSLYANLDDSSSTANLLVDLLVQDPDYDPSDQYNIFRVGQYEYRLYFAPDLSKNDIHCITYITSYNNNPPTISKHTVNNLSINSNGYYYVGNTKGSLRSQLHSDYTFKDYAIICLSIIAIVITFFVFRKKFHKPITGYHV